jgi:hypothetical protein
MIHAIAWTRIANTNTTRWNAPGRAEVHYNNRWRKVILPWKAIPKFCPAAPRDISKYYFSHNLCVLFFQTVTKVLGQLVMKLFWPYYLIKGSFRYIFWPRSAVKNWWGAKGTVSRESLGTSGLADRMFHCLTRRLGAFYTGHNYINHTLLS